MSVAHVCVCFHAVRVGPSVSPRRRCEARQGVTRRGEARRDEARNGEARRGEAVLNTAAAAAAVHREWQHVDHAREQLDAHCLEQRLLHLPADAHHLAAAARPRAWADAAVHLEVRPPPHAPAGAAGSRTACCMRARSRRRCGRGEPGLGADVGTGEPSPGADVGGLGPVPVHMVSAVPPQMRQR
jgi:hypothetical protein